MTIAYYASDAPNTAACAYDQAGATPVFTNVTPGTCTAASSLSPQLYVEVIVAIAESATGNPVVVLLNGLHITPLMTRSYIMMVVP
jgi:hypothetical protein